ncbi:ABC transporter substrate-binding protein [Paracraurococcus lichenis]|uniref:ABC transporter substrate-binding protein n=1 Tax=Paracraurococcus lichenis TaxID=3064888 RepID=A0ABT9E265_9PROT|nr:ABC transporter substrate-binding protein [Paracraurococcus sp. LOR1-02]MDO9710245.1 ABC transporter substrate-binding protein [Paracraurococcus sp. LOR1-02]
MTLFHRAAGLGLAALLAAAPPALAQQKVLRIAMTAADVPTTTGAPNNGFEGVRFLGYPVFEGLVLWDLSRADRPATLRPGLAESWSQDPADPKTWIFKLRPGVKFHDGSALDADAVIWNLDRYWKNDSPQFEPAGSGIARARIPILAGYRKIDDMTVALSTTRVASYFPYMAVYILMTSPQSFEAAGRDWAKVAMAPAGTGPFKLAKFTPRVSAELAKNEGYWDKARVPKLDRVLLLPIPEANSRLAALRSGQVDWIEVPPPDAIPSLKQAGFNVVTNSYPHVWPWFYQLGGSATPFKDVRVRQGLNYCVDRAGLVSLLNDTAEPSVGWLKPSDPNFGKPENRYGFDPAKGKALLAAAGFTPQKPLKFKVMISASGSGQMLPLPMNEYMQQNLKEACGVDVSFEVTEWNTLLTAVRQAPDAPILNGSVSVNPSSPSSDPAVAARYFLQAFVPPNGFNWGQWSDPAFEEAFAALENARNEADYNTAYAKAHERLVDNPPWLYIVHDLNPRAMSRRVRGFVSAQSWFQDLVTVDLQ